MAPETDETQTRSRLGHDIAARFARSGGPGRVGRPGLGTVARTSTQFALSTGRAPAVRRALQGLAPVRPAGGALEVRPPRWWRPLPEDQVFESAPLPAPPARGLRRGVVSRLHERGAPGSVASGLKSVPVPVRRPADVTAAGHMLTQRERRAVTAARTTSPGPPGTAPGNGSVRPPSAADGAVPRVVRRATPSTSAAPADVAATPVLGRAPTPDGLPTLLRRRAALVPDRLQPAAAQHDGPVQRLPGPSRRPGHVESGQGESGQGESRQGTSGQGEPEPRGSGPADTPRSTAGQPAATLAADAPASGAASSAGRADAAAPPSPTPTPTPSMSTLRRSAVDAGATPDAATDVAPDVAPNPPADDAATTKPAPGAALSQPIATVSTPLASNAFLAGATMPLRRSVGPVAPVRVRRATGDVAPSAQAVAGVTAIRRATARAAASSTAVPRSTAPAGSAQSNQPATATSAGQSPAPGVAATPAASSPPPATPAGASPQSATTLAGAGRADAGTTPPAASPGSSTTLDHAASASAPTSRSNSGGVTAAATSAAATGASARATAQRSTDLGAAAASAAVTASRTSRAGGLPLAMAPLVAGATTPMAAPPLRRSTVTEGAVRRAATAAGSSAAPAALSRPATHVAVRRTATPGLSAAEPGANTRSAGRPDALGARAMSASAGATPTLPPIVRRQVAGVGSVSSPRALLQPRGPAGGRGRTGASSRVDAAAPAVGSGVEALAAATPSAIAGRAWSGASAAPQVQRSPAPSWAASAASMLVAPPRGAGRAMTPSADDVVRRSPLADAGSVSSLERRMTGATASTVSNVGGHVGDDQVVIRRAMTEVPPRADQQSSDQASESLSPEKRKTGLSRSQLDEVVDVVIERIERRVIDELERRGRRHHPEVF